MSETTDDYTPKINDDYHATRIHQRPWGSWRLIESEINTIKILTVNPGGMLSLQKHKNRSEEWIAINPGLVAYIGNNMYELPVGQIVIVQPNCQHRLINPTAEHAQVIERIKGNYDEDDIVRLHDIYER